MSIYDIGMPPKRGSLMKISNKALQVLGFFLNGQTGQEHSGAEVTKALGIGSGTLYPLLMRFETSGWMESRWEEIDPSVEGRPRRRLYRLTALGAREATRELARIGRLFSVGEARPVWGVA
jgi:DNA-binding PadR family transcriptional regulator